MVYWVVGFRLLEESDMAFRRRRSFRRRGRVGRRRGRVGRRMRRLRLGSRM